MAHLLHIISSIKYDCHETENEYDEVQCTTQTPFTFSRLDIKICNDAKLRAATTHFITFQFIFYNFGSIYLSIIYTFVWTYEFQTNENLPTKQNCV